MGVTCFATSLNQGLEREAETAAALLPCDASTATRDNSASYTVPMPPAFARADVFVAVAIAVAVVLVLAFVLVLLVLVIMSVWRSVESAEGVILLRNSSASAGLRWASCSKRCTF